MSKFTARQLERADYHIEAARAFDAEMKLYDEIKGIIRETVEDCCGHREAAAYKGEWAAGERYVDSAISDAASLIAYMLYDAAYEEVEAAS